MKKKLISISCVVLALTMCISLISCSKSDKPKDKVVDDSAITTEAGENSDAQTVTDKNGNIIYPTDANGNIIAPTDENGKVVEGNKVSKVHSSTTQKTTKKNDKKDDKATTKKKEETTKKKADKTTSTTTTLHYTTVNPADPIVTPEMPLEDEYALTGSLAMFNLQQKYDSEKYVVNLIEETNDYATLYVFVLENNDIYSKAKVNLKNGKTTETITKTKKKLTYTL